MLEKHAKLKKNCSKSERIFCIKAEGEDHKRVQVGMDRKKWREE